MTQACLPACPPAGTLTQALGCWEGQPLSGSQCGPPGHLGRYSGRVGKKVSPRMGRWRSQGWPWDRGSIRPGLSPPATRSTSRYQQGIRLRPQHPACPGPLPSGPLPGGRQCDMVARALSLDSDAPGLGPALALTSCVTLCLSPDWLKVKSVPLQGDRGDTGWQVKPSIDAYCLESRSPGAVSTPAAVHSSRWCALPQPVTVEGTDTC